jgi:hypothetical protein
MLRNLALLTVALTLAIPALAETPSKAPVHKVAATLKPAKPQGKGNNGTLTPCVRSWNVPVNGRHC